jgi:1-acyl-sn-glycerol-3-phosphate acyltransferase
MGEPARADPVLVPLPPRAPRTGSPAIVRWIGRTLLRLFGWRLEGEFPDRDKVMIIVAPHSSGFDALWGLLAKMALGVHIEFMAKKELFWWPLGPILRAFGGFPVDRQATGGVVGALADYARGHDRLWLLIAPEGTRKPVTEWKSGFWRIARAADLPVVMAYFHYPEKIIGIGPTIEMSDDLKADMARIRAFYRPWIGRNRGTV